MAKQYIQLYYNYLDAIEALGDAERGRLFTALLEYGKTGMAQGLSGNERFVYPMMKAQIDRDNEAYEEQCRKNSENGKLGGRPQKPEVFATLIVIFVPLSFGIYFNYSPLKIKIIPNLILYIALI